MQGNRDIKILHIDDDRDFSDLFVLVFSQWFTITSMPDQNLSWEKISHLLQNNRFDAIITDYDIPGINGLEIMEMVRKDYPALPVILLTGQGNEEVAREAFLAGASDYFTKDLFGFAQKEKLVNSINRVISVKMAQEARRRSEEKYRALIDNSPDLIIRFDKEHRLLYINSVTCRYTGLCHESTLNMKMNELGFSHDICSFFEEKVGEVFKTGRSCQGQIQFSSQMGDFILDLILAPEPDIDGHTGSVICTGRDISSMMKARQALEKSEERLKVALDAASEGLWDMNFSTGDIYFSPYFYMMIGYEKEDLKPGIDGYVELIHPEWQEHIREYLIHFSKIQVNSFKYDYKIRHKDGSWRWIQTRGRVVAWDEKGQALRIVGTNTDITQQKTAQELLDRERDFLNKIIDFSPYCIMICEKDGRTIRINEAAKKLFHVKGIPDGHNVFLDGVLMEQHKLFPYFQEILNGNAVEFPEVNYGPSYFTENIPVGGLYLKAMGFPIVDNKGEVDFMVFILQDNTKRHLAEEALQQANNLLEWRVQERTRELAQSNKNLLVEINMRKKAQEMLRQQRDFAQSLIETAKAAIAVLDYRGRVVQLNKYLENLSGFKQEDLAGKEWDEFFFEPGDRPKIRQMFDKALNNGMDSTFTSPLVTASGQKFYLEWNLRHLAHQGESTSGIIAMGQDVTDILSAREDLIRYNDNYRLLLEAVPQGICELDIKGNVLYANKKMKSLIRCKNENITGMNIFSDFTELGKDEQFNRIFNGILKDDGKAPCRDEIEISVNGRPYRFVLNWTVCRCHRDKIEKIILIISEITIG